MKKHNQVTEKFIEALKNINPDEIAEKVSQEIEREEKERTAYSKTLEFAHVLSEIKKEVLLNKTIWDNDYAEPYLFSDVTNEQFVNTVFSVFTIERDRVKESYEDFHSQSVTFEGLELIQIYGQGVAIIVKSEHSKPSEEA